MKIYTGRFDWVELFVFEVVRFPSVFHYPFSRSDNKQLDNHEIKNLYFLGD